jgi:hypothetical protein
MWTRWHWAISVQQSISSQSTTRYRLSETPNLGSYSRIKSLCLIAPNSSRQNLQSNSWNTSDVQRVLRLVFKSFEICVQSFYTSVMYVGGLCEGPTSFWGHSKPKSIPVWLASTLATLNELAYRCLGVIPFAKSLTRLSVEMTQRTYWFSHARATTEIGYNPQLTWRDSVNFLVSTFKREYHLNTRHRRKSSPCLTSPHVTSGVALDQQGAI